MSRRASLGRASLPARRQRPVGRRPLLLSVGAVLLVGAVALLVAVSVLGSDPEPRTTDGDVAPLAEVTASSVATGTSPTDTVSDPAGRGWRSAQETVGAWIELTWDDPQPVRRVELTRPLDEPGATEGFLSFGDGSHQQFTVATTSPTTVVPVTPHSTDQLRVTFSGASADAVEVSLTRIAVATDASPADVERDDGGAGATITQNLPGGTEDSDPARLADGTPTDPGAPWTAVNPLGGSVTLSWDRPRQVAAIEIVGASSDARLLSATATFSDGGQLPVGAVLPDPARPTLVAAMPRATRSVTLTFDALDGPGPLSLSALRVHERGSTPERNPSGSGPTSGPTPGGCSPDPPGPEVLLAVDCPPSDSWAGPSSTLRVTAPGAATVTARVWPAELDAPLPPAVETVPDAAGVATPTIDLSGVAPGPFTVAVEAEVPNDAPRRVFLQLYRPGRIDAPQSASNPAAGRTLVYTEEFDRPVSLSPEGADADYAASKPTDSGSESFGDAPFPDPALGLGNVGVIEGMLRLGVQPAPPGPDAPPDGEPTFVGGMLASARAGGSGFSAQYGYFEARMLAPASPGTWPAFWLLPSDNLIAPTPVVAEIDVVELYGHEPSGACHSTHEFRDDDDFGLGQCDGRRFPSERDALTWHTYGVAVTPTENVFYIDGKVVATAPQVLGGDAPMFFLANLALGGGWPVDLSGVGNRAALYVDHIRVYV